MGLDAVVSLVSLFGPKVIDTVKGWIHRKDSPEATMASLAQSNPGALAEYVKAQTDMVRARIEQFNQDMPITTLSDKVPGWIAGLWWLLRVYRAAIRPAVITVAFVHIMYVVTATENMQEAATALSLIPEWIRYQYEIAISSWFGDRWK
uniref:Uncharacterized protein n=1 Tax=viral metagenome TaxID=1070528 RepID=A0A6M3XVN7_9ZZZZ